MLDGPDRRDRGDIQRDLHELGVRLVEVTGVANDSRHAVLNVFQHQIVFRLLDSQSSVDVADNQVIRQKVSPVCC